MGFSAAALLRWTTLTFGTHGRLLFPAIAAINGLAALGILGPVTRRWHSLLAGMIGSALLTLAAMQPWVSIQPAFALPPTLERLPSDAIALDMTYDGLALRGASIVSRQACDGGSLEATLYFENHGVGENLSLLISVLDAEGAIIERLLTYPGGGMLPTLQMEEGALYEDRYRIRLPDASGTCDKLQVRIEVGTMIGDRLVLVTPTEGSGRPVPAPVMTAADR
jgi:hypothetical protein